MNEDNNKPNPGSPKAIEQGCKCPVLDNAHGKGHYRGGFAIRKDCPLHEYNEISPSPHEGTKDMGGDWENDFIEKGAELEHIRWAKWQNYLHSFLVWNNDIQMWTLPHEKKEWWDSEIRTPYSMLNEKQKESDRKEARTYLPIIKSLISQTERNIVREIYLEISKGYENFDIEEYAKSKGIDLSPHPEGKAIRGKRNSMEDIIKKAIEGGCNDDPLFWQALGKSCGWDTEEDNPTVKWLSALTIKEN